ncbi:TetR/AcrR family transcriptional regulator C-terminal domain-containing protein [Saccharothrix sp. BKS2]|uniref:TetR/AcrR family transcriptional regulator n=1 Tax=Saccharothrix sp. BKS2 TaxID=3064400 RepID=UPI0039ECE37C
MGCAQCGTVITPSGRGRPRRCCGRACQARAYRARRDHGRPSRRPPPERPDRTSVVRAAIALADAEGLGALSPDVLARRLGIPVTSLRRHVPSREALLTAVVDAVLAEHRPVRSPDWRVVLEHEAREEWARYRRHPWAVAVLATTRPPLGPGVLATVDRFLAALSGHGLDHRTALSVYLLVSGYAQGLATTAAAEHDAARDTGVTVRRWWTARLGRLAGAIGTGRHPWLAVDPATPDVDLDAEFDFGLARVLDGVEVFLAGRGRPS